MKMKRKHNIITFFTILSLNPSLSPNKIFANASPWGQKRQNLKSDVWEEERYEDLPRIVFAPGGRLYAVDKTARSACNIEDCTSTLGIALKCRDAVVVMCTPPSSPHGHAELICLDGRPRPPLSLLGTGLVTCIGGNAIDGAVLMRRVQESALSLHRENGGNQGLSAVCSVDSGVLARRIADQAQAATQTMGGDGEKMLASSALIIGVGENPQFHNPQPANIWRIDPTGQFWNCHAAAVGRGAGAAESFLLKNMPDSQKGSHCDVPSYLQKLSANDALSLIYECIHETLHLKHEDNAPLRGLQALLIYDRGTNHRPRMEFLCGEELLNRVNKKHNYRR